MAYKVGQKKRNDYSGTGAFSTPVSIAEISHDASIKNLYTDLFSDNQGNISSFKELQIEIGSGGSNRLSTGNVYFLTITLSPSNINKIENQDSDEIDYDYQHFGNIGFKVLLTRNANPGESSDVVIQEIGQGLLQCYYDGNTITGSNTFMYVFSPEEDCDNIVFEINRNKYDIDNFNYYRTLVSESASIQQLSNLIQNGTQQGWQKIGFQSRPGTWIVVNREPIRVGRSGIYELDNKAKITSFMIVPIGGNVSAFLLDYAFQN